MPTQALDCPVFEADNHMYETKEALTQFLPDKYRGAIDYVDVHGRTKIVVRGHISDYIPNPTFDVVPVPVRRRTTTGMEIRTARAGARSSGRR